MISGERSFFALNNSVAKCYRFFAWIYVDLSRFKAMRFVKCRFYSLMMVLLFAKYTGNDDDDACLSFSFSLVFLGEPKKKLTNVFWFVTQKAHNQDWNHFIRNTKTFFLGNCSLSCYSLHVAHDNHLLTITSIHSIR